MCAILKPVEVDDSNHTKIDEGTDNLNDILKVDGNKTIYITQEKLNTIKTLELSQKGISSIDDLYYFKNLKSLDISNNGIADISILRNLPNLTYLNIQRNCIYNFSPILKFEYLNDFDIGMQELSGVVNQEITQNETFKFELLDIFKQSKKNFGKLYTSQNFTVDNVKINFWGDTATLNTSNVGDNEAVILINGGKLDKSYIVISYYVSAPIVNENKIGNAINIINVVKNTVLNNTEVNNAVGDNNTVVNNNIYDNTVTNNTVANNTVTNNTVHNNTNSTGKNTVDTDGTKNDDQGKDDTTIPIEKLPNTGDSEIIQMIIYAAVIIAGFAAIQYSRYRDIK